ncbi:MAG: AAA family ATPase, partial [Deltaproteobacteria bacterium]|nr:AAA family ATPase [Deltaproteobacteria bacterium]
MITKWSVSNFKSIRNETELNFAPLTVFAGPNSSGKSSFIQTILLVAQTLTNKVESRSIVLNGSLASLGQFNDIKSNGSKLDQIDIKFSSNISEYSDYYNYFKKMKEDKTYSYNGLKEISCEISFGLDTSSSNPEFFQIQPKLFNTRLSCVTTNRNNEEEISYISARPSTDTIENISKTYNISILNENIRQFLSYSVELDQISKAQIAYSPFLSSVIGCKFEHFLPSSLVYVVKQIDDKTEDLVYFFYRELHNVCAKFIGYRQFEKLPYYILNTKILCFDDFIHNFLKIDNIYLKNTNSFTHVPSEHSLSVNLPSSQTVYEWLKNLYELSEEDRSKLRRGLWNISGPHWRYYSKKNIILRNYFYYALVSQEPLFNKYCIKKCSLSLNLGESQFYIKNFISNVSYLGPVRVAPKSLYPLTPSVDLYDLGTQGENSAFIFDIHKKDTIKYIPSNHFKDQIDVRLVQCTLEEAVIDWLQYMGIADTVNTIDKGNWGHELKVRIPHSADQHGLNHVGVGVSQVLPILLMGLLANQNSILVIEQPELHLHPKVQSLLGDFFLSMALSDKQCIVETHSEALIDRLRYRIA